MRLILAGLVAVLAFSISSSVFNVISYQNAHHNCVQIESIKKRVRQRAIDDYNHLPATAKLLNLKVTPELRAKAKETRDNTLNTYAPQHCSGIFGG